MYIPPPQFDVLSEAIHRILTLGIMTFAAYRMFKSWMEHRYTENARTILVFLAVAEATVGDLIADMSLCIEPKNAERCIERMAAEGLVLVPIDPIWGLPSNALCRISPEGMRALRRA